MTEGLDDTDRLEVSLGVEDELLDALLVTVWLGDSETEPLVVTDGDDDIVVDKEAVSEVVDVEQAETLPVPDELAVEVVVPVTQPLGVDETDTVSDGDLLYVDETVLDDDIEFVTDAVRQCVAVPERVVE